MQSKLIIASLAAMAHKAHAVQESATQSSSDPASTLIGYYQNCQVEITNLTGTTSTMGDKLKLTPSFEFTGIDENCPELTATVWMEAPPICASSNNCPAEGMEVVISPMDIKNGSWSHDFEMNSVAGDWYAHVTVSPYGFECAMALTDGCTAINVTPVCNAKVTSFVGDSKATPGTDPDYIDENGRYYGPDGVTHTLNWGISELWNCNKCASFSVTDESGQSTVSSTMDAATLLQFSGEASLSTQLSSYTSYWPWNYTLDLFDCDGDVPNPPPAIGPDAETYGPVPVYPTCEIPCSVSIDSVNALPTGTTISQTVTETPVYTCEKLYPNWFTSTMNHDSWYTASEAVLEGDQSIIDSVPADSYNMTWANFPIWVNSTVEIFADNSTTVFSTCSDMKSYWPDCVVSMSDSVFSTETVEGTSDINSHNLALKSFFTGHVGPYCPTFDAQIVYTRDGVQVQTMNVESVLDNVSNFKQGQSSFNDGKWCATATMTAQSTKPGEEAITVVGETVCEDVTAPACQLMAFTNVGNLDGPVSDTNYMLTVTADASYTIANNWCSTADLTYSWGWQDSTPNSYTDFETDGFPYQAAMAANGTVTVSEDQYESDMDITVLLQVDYTSNTFTSQPDTVVKANDSFTHTTTCRPMFSSDPIIEKLNINADDISLVFSMQTATKSIHQCVNLFALIEVFDVETDTDRLITNFTLNSTEILAYQDQTVNTTIPNLAKENTCFMVRITYGQDGRTASQQTRSTGQDCWWSKCELSNPSISLTAKPATAEDGNSINWAFDTSVDGNDYCYTYSQDICITEDASQQTYCTTIAGQNASAHEVLQTGNFGQSFWTYSVSFTSDNQTSASDSDDYVIIWTESPCKFSFYSDLEAMSDTLNTVSIKQNTQVTSGAVCGDSTQQFVSNDLGNSTASALESHTWTLASTTGQYCFSTWIVFGNFPQFPQQTADICQTWIQGCEVQVTTLSMNFVTADSNTNTEAQANIVMGGVAMGSCNVTDVTASMTGTDNSSYSFNITDEFFTAAGQTVDQAISRSSDTYTVVVNIDAPLAQSVVSHQNMTTGVGFVNVLSDSDTITGTNMPPVCDVVASSITWVSYAEVTDYTGPMVATYSGVVTAELSCASLSANLRIKDNNTAAYYNETSITLVPSGDGHTYTWTQTIYGQNIYHSPIGKIQVWDTSNEADVSTAVTEQNLWAPPCYLVINNFAKTGQIESADQLRTVLDYNIQIAHFGDQACNGVDAVVSLQNGDVTTFSMDLQDSDLEVALSPTGFNVSIQTESSQVDGATLTWTDPRAIANQTAPADGFVTVTEFDCSVQIFDFCLTDAAQVADGRWAFNFTIRIEQNAQCGALSATMDLIEEGSGAFLTGVALDGSEMIDTFNCDCAKTFTVEADYDGAADSIFGQIDVRNGQQQIVQVMDSCTYDI